MKINAGTGLESLAGKVSQFIGHNSRAPELANMSMRIGAATDPDFQIDAAVLSADPLFVGDSLWGKSVITKAQDAKLKLDPESIGVRNVYNKDTKKWDMVAFDRPKMVGDAAPNLLAAQALSPASVGWISEQYKFPLMKNAADKMVSLNTGNDPWATVMSMGLLGFSGFAAIGNAGAANNRMSNAIEVISGAMSAPIINMEIDWRLTVDEVERSKSVNGAPWIGQAIAYKKKYADYALKTARDAMIYYGNTPTSTVGLISLNGATAWSGIGSSMSAIAAGVSTSKGSDMYALISKVIQNFLTVNNNQTKNIKFAMSPLAMNILGGTAYSALAIPIR
jgi:hypothetical protein